jgi:hypothetical protein
MIRIDTLGNPWSNRIRWRPPFVDVTETQNVALNKGIAQIKAMMG